MSGVPAGRAWWMLCAVLLLESCASTPATPAATGLEGLGARVLQQYIRPQTAALARNTQALEAALHAYCAQPTQSTRRAAVEARFTDVAVSWAGVEFLRFGPLVEQNRLEQFFFWPDPRGVMQRQLRSLLAAGDPAQLEAAKLREQSVAVQGLPALEYVLHAEDGRAQIAAGEATGRYRCAFAEAIGTNLVRLAGEIDAGWNARSPLAKDFAHPAPANDLYRDAGEVATEVLKALSTALHVARDQKLAPALGDDAASARGSLLPLYRSGVTAQFLGAQAAALGDFHAAGHFAASLPADSAWVDASLRDELRRLQQDFSDLALPADRAVADEEARNALVHAALLLVNARALVDEYLAPALGVNLGFNALDGD